MQQARAAKDTKEKQSKLAQSMKKVDNRLQNKDELIHGLEQLYTVTFAIASTSKDCEELLKAVTKPTGEKEKMRELLNKQQAACEALRMDVGISTGITVGASIVGFCTPGKRFLP